MKKQTTIKNFFSKRSSPDAAHDDATPKRPKLGSQSAVATEEAPPIVGEEPNLVKEESIDF
jgi:hypothetical protein